MRTLRLSLACSTGFALLVGPASSAPSIAQAVRGDHQATPSPARAFEQLLPMPPIPRAAALRAQDPPAKGAEGQEVQAARALDEAQLERARAMFGAAARSLAGVLEIHADYTQTQESLLLLEPLVSKGRFHLRLDPGCLVLELEEPNPLVIRSDSNSHRIYYPKDARAEVFRFEKNRLTTALIACLRADLEQVEETFHIRGYAEAEFPADVAGESPRRIATVTLVPRVEALERVMRELVVVFDRETGAPISVTQTNSEGEALRFELEDPRLLRAADLAQGEQPNSGVFERPLPPGTKVIEHAVPEKN